MLRHVNFAQSLDQIQDLKKILNQFLRFKKSLTYILKHLTSFFILQIQRISKKNPKIKPPT
jgi:hypothetical protein